jgi:predicted secreted protein
MIRKLSILLILQAFVFSMPAYSLEDQGLSSVMSIIDRAIEEYAAVEAPAEGQESPARQSASTTIVNLSRTLGKLSYSRLQCGEADVLAEFTQRVQQMPEDYRDPMRDAFQQGFDQSKQETPLLSEDECARLTQSRTRGNREVETRVKEEENQKNKSQKEPEPEPVETEDPSLRHQRIAELSGQLAYRKKFCGDKNVVNRDFNELIGSMPAEYREQAKSTYWKGYKRGKRLNQGLTKDRCN